MTNAEYLKLYAQARREAAALSLASRAKIAEVYRKAAEEAADVARRTIERGLSELTSERWASMAKQLNQAAEDITKGIDPIGKDIVSSASGLFTKIDASYLLDAVKEASASELIKEALIGRMTAAVNRRVVESLVTRIWADGYTYSDRIWNLKDDWLERIKATVSAGIAQGRDPIKIAKDIQVYTADGKIALVKRWGKLERGTAKFAKRIPGNVDWRAVRLVRSELYASLQDASAQAGDMNPGCTGKYNWLLSPIREEWPCPCKSLSEKTYTINTIPAYPHSHCECHVEPILRDRKSFVADLKRFARGDSVDYLDKWYTEKYQETT
jgi:F0F1-type ATP synthase membrane subunit b/b'